MEVFGREVEVEIWRCPKNRADAKPHSAHPGRYLYLSAVSNPPLQPSMATNGQEIYGDCVWPSDPVDKIDTDAKNTVDRIHPSPDVDPAMTLLLFGGPSSWAKP